MKKSTSVLLVLLACLLLWAASSRHAALLATRIAGNLGEVEPPANAPPLLAFTTVALGGFRGLLADVLWLRAAYLQDKGAYIELVQLSDWITKLEPRDAEVWNFHAWNMAYNVSFMMPELADRWRWVENGIRLLRDEGIVYDPGDPRLYFDLGWIFLHKIGGTTDDANAYFKLQWIAEMTSLLGGPSPDYDALAKKPEVVRRMREQYGLKPEIMREMDAEYGPLDWRVPQTHSLYWAYRGIREARGRSTLFCDRLLYQSMNELFRHGRLVYRDNGREFGLAPDPRLFDKVCTTYEKAFAKYKGQNIRTAYGNFLREAVRLLHTVGEADKAHAAFGRLQERFPGPDTAAGFDAFIAKPPEGGSPRAQ